MKKLIPLLLGGACVLASCGTGSTTKTETDTVQAPAPAAVDTTAFNITIAALPPQDLPADATPQQLAEFAWAEFFALNWQSSYNTSKLRATPTDTVTWNFRKPDATLAVWETYAHRTELLPNQPYTVLPFDAAPHYSFGKMPLPYPGPAQPSFTLFNNLDENNEIGSCDLYGQVGQPGGNRMVLYQAKVNRAEYNYIGTNYNTPAKLQAAADTTAVHIKKYKAYYKGATSSCDTVAVPGVLCLPCGGAPAQGGQGQGTIEIKTAWRMLTPAEDATKFFTRKVIYYRTKGTQVYYDNATFALVGMHIIHKTVNFPDFVFATWEHIDVEKENMGLSLLNSNGSEIPPYMQPYKRLHPIEPVTNYATAAAHRKLKALNPNSVWLNYRLTGVQGTPTGNTNTSNYFLANYVVESDSTLANFHGSGIGTPFDNGANTLLKGQLLTAGGCQGCHGVTQLKGTDFSFLLDGFQKPVLSPDTDTSMRAKLTHYLQHSARREARVSAIVAKSAARR
ncbi:hypothetical protein Q5H93_03060 [Hymenobacter sp. ASUV-10]|uniref:Cytochrome c domain-containing protein n=1 Tax=Hymenobacter aranciens TaxID=3063996 RepID=A0ABT9B7R8_9BACT|nr:hypothetical protein [Hymenobacter sp. ASUV-10]MDO7873698.1 hypothetical protein [Hymenobacter sp. ASUV-10]